MFMFDVVMVVYTGAVFWLGFKSHELYIKFKKRVEK